MNCQAGVEQNFGATCCLRSQTPESSLRTAAWTVGKGGTSSARGPVMSCV